MTDFQYFAAVSNEFDFTREILSQMGTPQEAWGMQDFILIGVIAAGLAIWVAIEIGLWKLITRFAKYLCSLGPGPANPSDN